MRLYGEKAFFTSDMARSKKSLGTRDAKLARAKFAAMQEELKQADLLRLDPTGHTLQSFADEYLAHRRPPRVKPQTCAGMQPA